MNVAAPILALDLGTQTGRALRSSSGLITSGSQAFATGRFDGAGMRFLRFKRWLTELRGTEGFAAVHFEEVRRHVGADAARCYGGFFGVLTAWCEHHEIPYSGVSVGTIKKFATGKGNADKAAMVAAVKARGYAEVTDDNEADAIALLHFCIAHENKAFAA
jgi:Holliday junction resolvasome RuvABC endonuclease subunit